jgi:predicted AlkP superfamily phosphohydrolase/phosphomutase
MVHLNIIFWDKKISKEKMADLVNEVSKKIRKGEKGKIVSGVPTIDGISWKVE